MAASASSKVHGAAEAAALVGESLPDVAPAVRTVHSEMYCQLANVQPSAAKAQ